MDDARNGQVPAPRRPAPLRRRHPVTPTELPFAVPGEDTPRVADLSALLSDIDALRLTLQTDLTLAAAALDAGADELAGELVDSDLAEVQAFAGRAAQRLAGLEDHGQSLEESIPDELAPVPLRRRRILSAAPLMAAAAALIGFVAFVPDRGGAASPDTAMASSSTEMVYELSRLAEEGASDEQLRVAAEELNAELAELIAMAADDPAAAQQALMLLETTTAVLSRQGDSGVLRGVMAETRALRQRLRDALPVTAQRPGRGTRPAVRQIVPVAPRVQEEPEKERAEEPKSSPKPSASPKPSPSSSPSPSPSPQQQDPSPEPSEDDEGPLPVSPGNIPGL